MNINHLFDAKIISKYGQQKGWEARGAYGSRSTYVNTSFNGENMVHMLVEKG